MHDGVYSGGSSGGGSYRLPQGIIDDLAKSGLTPKDLFVREMTDSERAATNCHSNSEGYVIPYFHIDGAPLPFYRVRLLNLDPTDKKAVKYKQPRKTANHIYFPVGFKSCLDQWMVKYPHSRVVVITEGEKKAACAVKMGIPCVGLGGVDSWRSKTIVLPKDTQLSSAKKGISARLPASDLSIPELLQLADGFGELIDAITQFNITPVIIFDSDRLGTLKSDVQRSATMLAYELRYLGVPSSRIKQVILPALRPLGGSGGGGGEDEVMKTGLDDFLLCREEGYGLKALLQKLLVAFNDSKAFPRHPNPKGFINTQLEGLSTRKDCLQIASVILAELDARGLRLRDSATGHPFYYDGVSHKLMPAVIIDKHGEVLHESAFGVLLYKEYGISGNDKRVLTWLASLFTGEEPISDVRPRRVMTLITEADDAANPDGIALQVSDSAFVAISPDPKKPIELCKNGDKGLLFEQNQVEPLDVDRALEYFDEFLAEALSNGGKLESWWEQTIRFTNLGREDDGGEVTEAGSRMCEYANLLFHISPFLQRWKGTQLPVELMTGEAGSGKSSLYMLRLQILTGRPYLRNLPTDIRDWQASISNAGGLHVIDNVHFSNKDLRQRMSDEICRLITEPTPHIEMRKLYTNTEQVRVPITATFAMTALHMPFQNADLIQRCILFKSCTLGKAPDGDWVAKQLAARGGREAWVAYQLVFLHLFMKHCAKEVGGWDSDFKTEHRLAHLEQCLTIAAKVLGQEQYQQIGGALAGDMGRTMKEVQNQTITEADWTMSGLKAFVSLQAAHNPTKRFNAVDIANWAAGEEEFSENTQLSSGRKLGRYMSDHKSTLGKVLNIRTTGLVGNRVMWIVGAIPQRALEGANEAQQQRKQQEA